MTAFDSGALQRPVVGPHRYSKPLAKIRSCGPLAAGQVKPHATGASAVPSLATCPQLRLAVFACAVRVQRNSISPFVRSQVKFAGTARTISKFVAPNAESIAQLSKRVVPPSVPDGVTVIWRRPAPTGPDGNTTVLAARLGAGEKLKVGLRGTTRKSATHKGWYHRDHRGCCNASVKKTARWLREHWLSAKRAFLSFRARRAGPPPA